MLCHYIPLETLGGAARSLFRVVRGPFDLYTTSGDGPLHSTLVISNPLFSLLGNSIWSQMSLGTLRLYRSTSLHCLDLTVLPWTLYHRFRLSPSYFLIVLQYKYSDVCSRPQEIESPVYLHSRARLSSHLSFPHRLSQFPTYSDLRIDPRELIGIIALSNFA
jgi:hypothetical protein